MPPDEYLLDNRTSEAAVRFGALAALFDPSTFRHIDALGIAHGWRCWEVGAGSDTVPRWLAERVGPTGQVIATDIDVRWAREAGTETLVVRYQNVGTDEPPDIGFDLVHARLVLVHVRERERALESMMRSLRPGGWLLVEDADPALQPLACLEESGPEQALANRLRTGFRALLAERGVDLAYGRKLPRLLRELGFADVEADAYFPITFPASAVLESATVNLVREALVRKGLASETQIAQHLANVAAGRVDLATSPMISAWGRRP